MTVRIPDTLDALLVPIDAVRPDPANYNQHSAAQIEQIAASLVAFGFDQPILARRNGLIIAGHGRLLAARQVGMTHVPVVYTDLDGVDAARRMIGDNRLAALAEPDTEALAELLRQLQAEDALGGTGYDDVAVEALLKEVAGAMPPADDPGPQVDRAAELQAKWGTALGQVWEIPSVTVKGRAHRLLCGDSTKAEDVARLMDGQRAALLATDPPYNVSIEYGDNVDDDKSEAEYEAFTRAWFGVWRDASERQVISPGCNNLARWCRYFDPYHVAPWTKTNAMTNGKVSRWWCWEPVLFYGDKWIRRRSNDVFDYPIGQQSGVGNHPCPKPLPMWADIIANYTEPCDVVAEAFAGSGTTFVAAEQNGRIGYGMELEPKYVAVILERLTGLGLSPHLLES